MEKTLRLLEYNFWANDQFIGRLADKEDLPADITRLFSHVLSAHHTWLSRVAGQEPLRPVWDDIPPGEWESLNMELYHETTDMVKSRDLEERITYKNTREELFTHTFLEILTHVVNHSTYHRGQVALLMRQKQMLPPPSDLIVYYRK